MPWPWNSDEPEYETPVGNEKKDSCFVVLIMFGLFGSGLVYGVFSTIL